MAGKQSTGRAMEISSPRHRRSSFADRCDAGLIVSLSSSKCAEKEIIDFSPQGSAHSCPTAAGQERAQLKAKLISFLERSKQADREPANEPKSGLLDFSPQADSENTRLFKRLSELCIESANRIASKENLVPGDSTRSRSEAASSGQDIQSPPQRWISRKELRQSVSSLSDGRRLETFANGSQLIKDSLGRVKEIYSESGESLLIKYDETGKISSFTRSRQDGSLHSSGKKEGPTATIRDADSRVMAMGDSMSVDPWGRLCLHARHGQYYSIDLVAGVMQERRRIINAHGQTETLTAVFTQDGFRMATAFALPEQEGQHQARLSYRFYGRDGSLLEFNSDKDLSELSPARSAAPATIPVHSSWLKEHQANTAWDSVKSYLSRFS